MIVDKTPSYGYIKVIYAVLTTSNVKEKVSSVCGCKKEQIRNVKVNYLSLHSYKILPGRPYEVTKWEIVCVAEHVQEKYRIAIKKKNTFEKQY